MSLEYTTDGRTLTIIDEGIIYIDNENNSYTLEKRKIEEIYVEQTKEQKKTGEGTIIIIGGKYNFRLNNMKNANEIKKDIQYYLKHGEERPKQEKKPIQPEKREIDLNESFIIEGEKFFRRANKLFDIWKIVMIVILSILSAIVILFIIIFIEIISLF